LKPKALYRPFTFLASRAERARPHTRRTALPLGGLSHRPFNPSLAALAAMAFHVSQ